MLKEENLSSRDDIREATAETRETEVEGVTGNEGSEGTAVGVKVMDGWTLSVSDTKGLKVETESESSYKDLYTAEAGSISGVDAFST